MEMIASSNANLYQKAVEQAGKLSSIIGAATKAQPGVTLQSHEVIYTFEFVTSQ
jgi:hypothetical protein